MSDGKHPVSCKCCGMRTYRSIGICRRCEREGTSFPPPAKAPEDYLTACAQELLRRHNERHELLVRLGIKAVAS